MPRLFFVFCSAAGDLFMETAISGFFADLLSHWKVSLVLGCGRCEPLSFNPVPHTVGAGVKELVGWKNGRI